MTKENLGILIVESQDSLYRVARSLLSNDHDCGDAIHEAIVKAFSRLDSLREERFAKTWLTRIVINECYEILRARSRIVSLEDTEEAEAAESGDYADLYEAVDRLPHEEQLAITLYYSEGYKIAEIADMLGISEGTVKSRLSRARTRLRAYLDA